MRLTCPSCGFYGPPDAFLTNAEEARAVLTALAVPAQLAAPLQQYLRLFRPAQRALTARRLDALLGELVPMIEAATIERKGRTWPAPVDYWRAAIEEMLVNRDRLSLPLKTHGYLFEIITGLGNKAESHAEQKREQERAYAYSGKRTPAPAPGPLGHYVTVGALERAPMPSETRESIKRILGRGDGDAG